MDFVGNLSLFAAVKKFANRLRIDKVIAMVRLAQFFYSQCTRVRFSTTLRLSGEYLRKEIRHRQPGTALEAEMGSLRYPRISWSTNVEKWDRFFASIREGRPPNRTQLNFATCWEVSQICKRMPKIGGIPSPKLGSYRTAYFATVFT